jgi:uncharacterized protein YndB with AHSA1/START domain
MQPSNEKIIVKTSVNANIEKVWKLWTTPEHIMKWNNASDDWQTPSAVNDLKNGGTFSYRMEAKDGSFAFDFGGTYTEVKPGETISYTIGDGRKVEVLFKSNGEQTDITETFEAESTHPVEVQQTGWQAILNNFKKYVESN